MDRPDRHSDRLNELVSIALMMSSSATMTVVLPWALGSANALYPLAATLSLIHFGISTVHALYGQTVNRLLALVPSICMVAGMLIELITPEATDSLALYGAIVTLPLTLIAVVR